MQKVVLSNRSQSYLKLKKYQEAESDADAALGFEAEHLKSLQRRGTARYYLGKYRLSLKDFSLAQSLQFTQQIAEYQKKVLEKMDKIRTEMLEKMKRKGHMLLNQQNDLENDDDDEDGIPTPKPDLELIRVTVQELNPPAPSVQQQAAGSALAQKDKKEQAAPEPPKQPKASALKQSPAIETVDGGPKKKKKKKAKGIGAFLEDDEEAKAFQN